MKLAIIGLGVISAYYVAAIRSEPECRLAAVCDLLPEKLEEFARQGCAVYTDYRDLLRADVDAVIVNLPNDLHFAVCEAALTAGKHVCCEKPLALTVEQASRLTSLATERGLVLLTAFHRRYNDNVVHAKRVLQAAPPPRAVRIDYLERIEEHCGRDAWYLDPARCGGGCVADNGPNVFDTLIELLGPLSMRTAQVTRDPDGVDVKAQIRLTASHDVDVEVNLDWAFGDGEKKTIAVEWGDRPALAVDMLAGFPRFKSSLEHEYVHVLRDFLQRASHGLDGPERGLEIARLIAAVYSADAARRGGLV